MRTKLIISALAAMFALTASPLLAQTGSQKTQTQLNAEVNLLWPDQNQGTITPLGARQTLLDMIASTLSLSGITATQTSPTSGSAAGPYAANLFNITDSFSVTGTGTDSTGLSNGGAVGFRVNTFFSGANVHATGTLISGLYTSTVTSTAAQGDITGLAGTAYCNVACSISGFLEGLNGIAQVGPSGSGVNVLVGVDAGAMILTGGSANYRFGMNVASLGNVQGTTNDAAIALMGTGGGTIAWKNGILLTNASGGAPISTTGSLFKSDTAYTLGSILDFGNITVTGNIAAFPFLGISGAGKAIFGAPIGTLAPTYNFEVTAASSGNVGITVGTNTTTGFSSITALNSTTTAEVDVVANEPNRTAVHFGQTVGNWGEIIVTSPNGLLLGTAGLVPVVFGSNNTERMRLLLGLSVGTTTDPGIGSILANKVVQTVPTTVASLPTCNAAAKGARTFVTDSNAASYTAGIGAVVAAGGTTNVPVSCDGTNWRIGANDNIPESLRRKFA